MWIDIPKELEHEIELVAKNYGISPGLLVGSLVETDFNKLVDLAKAITRLRKPAETVSLAEMRRRLASDREEEARDRAG
jgi:hypothetical protein